MSRSRLYLLLSTACMTGYAWLAFSFFHIQALHSEPGVCLFRYVTGIPCPSCGSTRAALSILHGDIISSLALNPFGIVLMLIMLISPLWILYDIVNRKSSLHKAYCKSEIWLRKRFVAVPLILIVLANWIWNIAKGL